jgi:tape measure domain-containing protein
VPGGTLNLGSIQFSLGMDTRGLDAAVARMEAFGRTVSAVQGSANRGLNTSIEQLRRQENALLAGMEKLATAQDRINRAGIAPEIKSQGLAQANQLFQELSARLTELGKSGLDPTKFDRAMAAYRQGLAQVNRDIAEQVAGAKAVAEATDLEARAAASAAQATERQTAALFRAQEAAKNLAASIERSSVATARPQAAVGMLDRIQGSFGALQSQMGTGPVSNQQAAEFQRMWTASINEVKREFATLQREVAKPPPPAGWEQFNGLVRGLGDASLLASGRMGGLSLRLFALSTLVRQHGLLVGAAAGAIIGMTTAVYGLGESAVTAAIKLQQVEMALKAVSGNAMIAQTELKFVHETANQSGTVFTELAVQYGRFSAATTQVGMSLGNTHKVFQELSMAAGTLHLPAESVQAIMNAFEQMMSKGKVVSEELRRQLGNQLPAAFAIAAKAMFPMAKSATEAQSMLEQAMRKGTLSAVDFVEKFTSAMVKAYHIDMSKPIQTLQAELNRSTNAWFDFSTAMDKAFGISKGFQASVHAWNQTLEFLSTHMSQIAGVVGALAGAFVGLAAAMAVTAITSWISSMGGLVFLLQYAAAEVVTFVRALLTMNFAMMANPIGGLVTLFLRLAAVLGGAYAGYEMLTSAVEANNSAMGDTSGIEAYIDAQLKAGNQTRSTTLAMIQQVEVMNKIAVANAQAAMAKANEGRTPSLGTKIKAAVGAFGETLMDPSRWGENIGTVAQRRLHEMVSSGEKEATTAVAEAHRTATLYDQLQHLLTLPETKDQVGKPIDSGKKHHEKSLEGITNKIKDLMDAARIASMQLAQLFAGPDQHELLDDLGQAIRITNNLTPKEQARAAALLGVANSTEAVTGAIQELITHTREANEVSQDFIRIWEDIDKGQRKLQNIDLQLSAIQEYGANFGDRPEIAAYIDGLGQAAEMVERLQRRGEAGQQALAVLGERLAQLGYTGSDTTHALAQFIANQAIMEQKAKATVSALNQEQDALRKMGDAQLMMQAYSSGLGGGNANSGEAMQRLLERRDALVQYGQQLLIMQVPLDEVQAKLETMDQTLIQQQGFQIAAQKAQKYAEAIRSTIRESMDDAVDAIFSVVDGTEKLGSALEKLFLGIAKKLTMDELSRVFDNLVDSIFGGTNAANANAGNLANAALSAHAASAGLSMLNAAALAAAAALNQVAIAGGGTPGAGGGGIGGIIGSFLGSLFGGGGTTTGTPNGDFNGIELQSFDFGRAAGGPVSHGWSYRINEQGVSDREVFVPGASGWIGSIDKLMGRSGGMNHYDFSTSIDARGATPDAVDELRRVMLAREARLRSQMPSIIDSRVVDNRLRGRAGG